LAVVNAKKEFIMVDAGMNGRISDGGVVFYSKFGELFQQCALNLPKPTPLPNTAEEFPYVFVADEAFALNVHIMKPTLINFWMMLDKNLIKDCHVLKSCRECIWNTGFQVWSF
jgi:hypothetical protein